MAHLTCPAVISGVSAGIFPETAAGNRVYRDPCICMAQQIGQIEVLGF